MTRLLSDVLHEHADSAPGPQVDLDAIVRDGDRSVRRSRLSTGLAAAAAVAAVVAGSSFVLPGLVAQDQDTRVAGSTPPFAERRAGYAMDGVIHWGDETFPVGMPVTSYVQTDDGFVLTNRKGEVFLFDGTDSQRIGFSSNNRLRADDTGSLVAWVDRAEDGHTQYVVYDTGSMTERARMDDTAAGPSREPSDQGAEVFAVDDGSAYWRTVEGLVRYDVASGDLTVLASHEPPADPSAKAPLAYAIEDVADGRIAYLVDAGQGASMKVADEIDLSAPTLANASNAVLSPDGRFLGVEEDDNISVYDTTTGDDVTPSLPGYPFAVVTGWVDEHTATVFAIKDLDAEPYPFNLLTCDVPTGACDVATHGDVPTDSESFVVPVGDPMT